MVARGERWKEGIVREFGIDMFTRLYLKWITNVQYRELCSMLCGSLDGEEWIHVYGWLSPFAVHLELPNIDNQLESNIE